ncbi:hypothetical protein [Schleiferia thermophila]|jgi:hypothetical protein|uniref:hypothetical protein n=1 Tax=Schleiferia thermophila TaxID=884107 RepID=UPI0004E76763|nr:hypothetical protein [Schleiferia thermophila]KFD39824.1 hypothetical protein AT05_03440 [Schleiferia thermophila str. Yellowstone]PMB38215.1 hypothetical protein CEN47_06930 [Fischerella thermalis CCMEE 5319]
MNFVDLRIRAFRSIEDRQACLKYVEGHEKVLEEYGVPKVTSAKAEWIENPDVYPIVAESQDGEKVFGGARIQIRNDDQVLPVEDALRDIEPRFKTYIQKELNAGRKIAELCGLWNSKAIAGRGVSWLLTKACVAKAGVTLAQRLKIDTLFVFCSPFTVQMVRSVGFVVETSLGMDGRFEYPKPDMLATLLVCKDLDILSSAEVEDRKVVFSLRENPRQIRTEKGPKGDLNIEYLLDF